MNSGNANPHILIIDDQNRYSQLISRYLPEVSIITPGASDGVSNPSAVASPRLHFKDGLEALEYLEFHGTSSIDAVFLDVHFETSEDRLLPLRETKDIERTKRYQGLAILRAIRERFPELPVMLMTSYEDIGFLNDAVDLRIDGLTTFLDDERLDIESLRLQLTSALRKQKDPIKEGDILWGHDRSMRDIRRRLTILAQGSLPILLEGETGTGKSYLARFYIHPLSKRSGPFVVLDLSTVPRDLVAAHLFGAVKGAYTGAVTDRKGVFQAANRGTLFLDEIQNASLDVQRQLLLVLEDGIVRPLGSTQEYQVDVKLIAATNTSLERSVTEGRFRADLYMRLNPATRIEIPALKNRPIDLHFLLTQQLTRALDDHFHQQLLQEIMTGFSGTQRKHTSQPVSVKILLGTGSETPIDSPAIYIPRPALKLLTEYSWPGNLRELTMVTHNLVTFTLVQAVEAVHDGNIPKSVRFQVDPAWIHALLMPKSPSSSDSSTPSLESIKGSAWSENTITDEQHVNLFKILVSPQESLNHVSRDLERQMYQQLYHVCNGQFRVMAKILLDDSNAERKVRLRFNQLGLKVRNFRVPIF